MATVSLARTGNLCARSSSRGVQLRAAARAPVAARRSLVVTADSRKAVVVLTGTAGVAGEVVFTQEGNGASVAPPSAAPDPARGGARSSAAWVCDTA